MTTLRELVAIPTAAELDDRLTAGHRLLTANKWERAAIVYAFTDIGGPRNTAHHHPTPPRVTIREFANRGYGGLRSVKAVQRYRRAWEYAVKKGWAAASEPGGMVELPEEDFPSWEDFMEKPEFRQRTSVHGNSHLNGRQRQPHFLTNLSTIKFSLGRIIDTLTAADLDDEIRDIIVGYADAIEADARRLRELAASEEVA